MSRTLSPLQGRQAITFLSAPESIGYVKPMQFWRSFRHHAPSSLSALSLSTIPTPRDLGMWFALVSTRSSKLATLRSTVCYLERRVANLELRVDTNANHI